ncbi:MAG TPA: TetR/AcrR family transcriptional regulator [Ktedonobacterales bacterium]
MDTGITGQAQVRVGRQRNPRGQGERLREEILDAADALLAAGGDARTLSLRGVAKRVGIAATSVYLHFPEVDDLKVAVVERGFAELDAVRDAASRGISDPAEALLARFRAYARFALDHPGRYRLMFGPGLPPSLAFDAEQSPARKSFQILVRSIKQWQEATACNPDDDPVRVATMLWAAVHGFVLLRMDRPRFPWPPLDEMVTETVRRLVGFATGSPPASGAGG